LIAVVDEQVCVAVTVDIPGRCVTNTRNVVGEGSTVHNCRLQLHDDVHRVPIGLASEVCVRWILRERAVFVPQRHKVRGCYLSGFTGRAVREPASVRTHLDHRELVTIKGAAVRVLHVQQRWLIAGRLRCRVAIRAAPCEQQHTNKSYADNSHTGKANPGGAEVGPFFV